VKNFFLYLQQLIRDTFDFFGERLLRATCKKISVRMHSVEVKNMNKSSELH
jgi:hypothetical protein